MESGGEFSGAVIRGQRKVFPRYEAKHKEHTGDAFSDTLSRAKNRPPHELPPTLKRYGKPNTGGLAGEPLEADPNNVTGFRQFNTDDIPRSSTNLVVASRRSGKSVLVNHILQLQQRKRAYTHIFLISDSGASFKGIPKRFRSKSLATLDRVVDETIRIGRHNKKLKKQSEMHHNRVAMVIDDMGHLGGKDGLHTVSYTHLTLPTTPYV